MTEQELEERIIQILIDYSLGHKRLESFPEDFHFSLYNGLRETTCNQILALVKEALPELAKEAGYKLPEEIREIIKQSAFALSDKHKREVEEARLGYVKLAKDRSLPKRTRASRDYELDRYVGIGHKTAQQDMLKSGWRKVEMEKK